MKPVFVLGSLLVGGVTATLVAHADPSLGHPTPLFSVGADVTLDPIDYAPRSMTAGGNVKVATNGTDALVAWQGTPGTQVARLSAAGVLLDPEPLPIRPPSIRPPTKRRRTSCGVARATSSRRARRRTSSIRRPAPLRRG